MKKRALSILLTLCMLFSMMPSFTISASAADSVTLYISNAATDDTAARGEGATYKTFMGAVNQAQDGDTIKLADNFVEPSATDNTISNKTLTIDFNGYSYTSIYNVNVPYAIAAYTGSRVIVTDSSTEHTGKLIIAKNSDDKCNDYALYCGGNSDGNDSGDGGVYVGEVSDLLGELETDQAGRMYIDYAKVEVPTDMQQVEAICSCGTRGAVFINDTFTTNGMVCSSSSAVVWVAMDAIDKLECYGIEGMVAVPLAEDMTLSNDLDLGVCRLLVVRGKTVTLNMNGHNITGKYGNIYVNPTSSLTIKNSGAVKSAMTNSISVHQIYGTYNNVVQWYNKAEPNIENHGTLTVEGNVYIKNDGTATKIISSKSTKTYPYGIYQIAKMNDDAMLTVNVGAEIYAAGGAIVSNDEWYVTDASKIHTSTVTINGGSFRASNDAVSIPAGSLNVKNATLEGNYGIWIGADNKMMEKLGPLDNVDFSVTQSYSTGIAISSSTQSSAGAGEPYSLHDIRINKSATAVPIAFLNETSGDIQLSGKNTYINCTSLYSLTQGYPGAPTGTGNLIITGGIYSVDPSAYVPDSDGVKDYAVLTLSTDPLRYLVAPWTEVGTDNAVTLDYGANDVASDGVDINALSDTEGVISDPAMVAAGQFTLSSSADSFTEIEGLTVTGFTGGSRLTVQKTKTCEATEAYVWYGGRSVGQITIGAGTPSDPTYEVSGDITSPSGRPTAALVRNGVTYSAMVSRDASPYSYTATVPAGIYNLVVSVPASGDTDAVTVTVLVEVVAQAVAKDVTLPSGAHNSKVTVEEATTEGAQTPNVEAGGLDTIAETVGAQDDNTSKKVLIELKVKENENSTNASDVKASIADDGKLKGVVMDIDLLKQINEAAAEKIPEVKQEEVGVDLVTVVFHLPENLCGKTGYAIYRYHGSAVDKITETVNGNGEYLTVSDDATTITANLKYFSTYAIGYNDTPTTVGNTIYANGTALYIDATGVYIDLDRDGVLDEGEPAYLTSSDLSAYSIYGGYENDSFEGNTLITQVAGSVAALNGGSASGTVTGNTVITLKGGTAGTVSGGADVTGTKTVNVSGNPKVTTGIDLATLTDSKVTINGYLTDFDGGIVLTNSSATAANTVVASATAQDYLTSSNGVSKASAAFTIADYNLDTTSGVGSAYNVVITNANAGLIIYTAAQDNTNLDSGLSDKKHFSAGETVTVDIYAKSTTAFNANSFQFTLDYPASLTLSNITTTYTGTAKQNGDTFAFTFTSGSVNIPVNSTGVKIATATFTVGAAPTDGASIDIAVKEHGAGHPLGMGEQGTVNIPATVGDKATVTLNNLTVTLHSTANAAFGATTDTTSVAYARYGRAGLYTDNTYGTLYSFPTIAAETGYRLKDAAGANLWGNATVSPTTTYADNAAISGKLYTQSENIYVLTTGTVQISFTTGTNGALSSYDALTVDSGSTLAAVSAATGFPTITPDAGYKFAGWKVNGAGDYLQDTYAFASNTSLTPIFVDASYTFTDSTPATITLTTGAGITDGTVSHAANATFTLAPADTANDCYYISVVTVTIGGTSYTGYTTANETDAGGRTITIPATAITGNVVVTASAVNYHTVSFAADTGIDNTAVSLPKTAYVKHGDTKLYTTIAKAATNTDAADFTVPTMTAQSGYRLYDATNYWYNGTSYSSTAAITNQQVNANTAWTAKAVKTWVITPAAATGGSIGSAAAITVDDGTLLGNAGMPTVTPTNTGWSFSGWQDLTTTTPYGNDTPISKDVTLTAVFVHNSFNLSTTSNQSTVTYTSGTTVNDTKITHGTDIVFTATPNADYVITAVGYSVNGVNGGTTTSVALNNGTYNIPGSAITGDVTVLITTIQYHTVTFQSGTGNTLTPATAYVQDGGSKLFSSLNALAAATNETPSDFNVPTPQAAIGYRLAADTAAEPLWSNNGDNAGEVTSTNIGVTQNYPSGNTVYNADVTYTAHSIKQYTITFAAGEHGSLTGTASIVKDSGSVLTSADIPTPTPDAHYEFVSWNEAPLGATVTADKTYTASFRACSYTISFNAGSVGDFTAGDGIVTTTAPNGTITYGTAADFTFALNTGYRLTAVQYTLDGTNYTPLTENNGKYTIHGESITGNITVVATTIATHTISFIAGENGTLTGQTAFTLDDSGSTNPLAVKSLTTDQLASVAPSGNTGYEFKCWQIGEATYTTQQLQALTFTQDTTVTAVFGLKDNIMTDQDNVIVGTPTGLGNDYSGSTYSGTEYGYAHYNTDVTFSVTTDKVVSNVYYSIDGGDRVKIEPTITNGTVTYTIPGTAITGAVTVTADTVTGTFEFILRDQYSAIVNENYGKKIAVFNTEKLTNGSKYVMQNGREFYWSERYNAYVIWVSDTETAATMAVGITTATGNAIEIGLNNGDIDGDGFVTAADAGFINDCLHGQRIYGTTDLQLFRLDVCGTGSGVYAGQYSWKYASVTDIEWVLDDAVGLHS